MSFWICLSAQPIAGPFYDIDQAFAGHPIDVTSFVEQLYINENFGYHDYICSLDAELECSQVIVVNNHLLVKLLSKLFRPISINHRHKFGWRPGKTKLVFHLIETEQIRAFSEARSHKCPMNSTNNLTVSSFSWHGKVILG